MIGDVSTFCIINPMTERQMIAKMIHSFTGYMLMLNNDININKNIFA